MNFRIGDIAYLVENGRYIIEGRITGIRGETACFRYVSLRGGTRVGLGQLYASEEAAMAEIRGRRAAFSA